MAGGVASTLRGGLAPAAVKKAVKAAADTAADRG